LEQIEEWNEYGELKDQIASTQDFGTFTAPAATTATSLSPGAAGATTASTPQRSGPPSRASSETRHILISEPTNKQKSGDGKPAESAMNMTMRQLGAEAAAKAAQKKVGNVAKSTKPVTSPTEEKTSVEPAPSSASKSLTSEAALESPTTAAEVTAAKTPAQLDSEGATRTSVGKIADSEDKLAAGAADLDRTKSTEEQQLEMRRSSSIVKAKSGLSDVTPVSESETVSTKPDAEPTAAAAAVDEEPTEPEQSAASGTAPSKKHRGSDVADASPEEIRAIEKKLSIPEVDEEHDEDEAEKPASTEKTKASTVSTSDDAEKEATKDIDPQSTDAKDADKAGVSVGD
jgi:hypothetical protein